MYLLGIDIGTTGTKSMLISSKGEILTSAYREYDLITEGSLVEQKAEDWWGTVVDTVHRCMQSLSNPEQVAALSMSTQGASMALVDAAGNPIGNAITWMDGRGSEMVDLLNSRVSAEQVYLQSGWKTSGTLCATKVLWFKKYHPELLAKAHKILTTVDFVNYKLTGRYAIDQTNAGITQLFDMNRKCWSPELLAACEITEDILPEVVPSGEVIGCLTEAAAAELGLTTATKVVSGFHDQYAAATGAGALKAGDVLLSTGTAWAPLGISDKPLFDLEKFLIVGNHVVDGLYGTLCTIPTAGVGLEWLRRNFGRQKIDGGALRLDSFAEIDMEAAKRRPSTEDLFFFPTFNGSGYPRWNENAKAGFVGLSLSHDVYDLALAVMEGIAFAMREVLDGYAAKGLAPKSLRLVGGASKSPLWTEIISNTTGLPITRFKEANIACIGAAAAAGYGCGMFTSFAEASEMMYDVIDIPAPSGALRDYYQNKYERYRKIAPMVEQIYHI